MRNFLNCKNDVSENEKQRRAGRIYPPVYKSLDWCKSQNNIMPDSRDNHLQLKADGQNQKVKKGRIPTNTQSIILVAARKQLAGFRIFTANIGTERRILERLEAAIMHALDKQPMPLCDIPDKGMMLAACDSVSRRETCKCGQRPAYRTQSSFRFSQLPPDCNDRRRFG